MPQPRIQTVRLDHERTKLLGVGSSGLWIIVPGGSEADTAAVNRAYRDAEHFVAGVRRCRMQTEEVLSAFLRALGWTVEIGWNGPGG